MIFYRINRLIRLFLHYPLNLNPFQMFVLIQVTLETMV